MFGGLSTATNPNSAKSLWSDSETFRIMGQALDLNSGMSSFGASVALSCRVSLGESSFTPGAPSLGQKDTGLN